MRKIVFFMDAGMGGTERYDGYSVPDIMTDKELEETAWELAFNHAGSYGDVVPDYDYEGYEYQISEGAIGCGWSDYNADNHDKHMLDNSFPEL